MLLVIGLIGAEIAICVLLYALQKWLALETATLYGLTMMLGNAIVLSAVLRHKGLSYRSLFHATPVSMAAVAGLLIPALVITTPLLVMITATLMSVVTWQFPMSASEIAMFMKIGSNTPGMILVVCAIGPVLEEMLLRGVILRSFLQQYGRWPAICGSAALFGIAHLNLYQFVAATLLGIFLGWLYERTCSLLPCIALHATYNAACLTASASGLVAGPGNQFTTFPPALWAASLALGMAGLYALRRMLAAPRG